MYTQIEDNSRKRFCPMCKEYTIVSPFIPPLPANRTIVTRSRRESRKREYDFLNNCSDLIKKRINAAYDS